MARSRADYAKINATLLAAGWSVANSRGGIAFAMRSGGIKGLADGITWRFGSGRPSGWGNA